MKRSEINRALRALEAMCEKYRCYLPPFCRFTPDEWKTKGHEYDEVRECMLGWDITDYGLGNFDKIGFSLITIRNGSRNIPQTTSTGSKRKTSSTAAAETSSSASTIPRRTSRSTMNRT